MIELSTRGGLTRVGNENLLLQITTVKLDRTNYLSWSYSTLYLNWACKISMHQLGKGEGAVFVRIFKFL